MSSIDDEKEPKFSYQMKRRDELPHFEPPHCEFSQSVSHWSIPVLKQRVRKNRRGAFKERREDAERAAANIVD